MTFAGNAAKPQAKPLKQARAAIKLNRRRLMLYARLGPPSRVESPNKTRKSPMFAPLSLILAVLLKSNSRWEKMLFGCVSCNSQES